MASVSYTGLVVILFILTGILGDQVWKGIIPPSDYLTIAPGFKNEHVWKDDKGDLPLDLTTGKQSSGERTQETTGARGTGQNSDLLVTAPLKFNPDETTGIQRSGERTQETTGARGTGQDSDLLVTPLFKFDPEETTGKQSSGDKSTEAARGTGQESDMLTTPLFKFNPEETTFSSNTGRRVSETTEKPVSVEATSVDQQETGSTDSTGGTQTSVPPDVTTGWITRMTTGWTTRMTTEWTTTSQEPTATTLPTEYGTESSTSERMITGGSETRSVSDAEVTGE